MVPSGRSDETILETLRTAVTSTSWMDSSGRADGTMQETEGLIAVRSGAMSGGPPVARERTLQIDDAWMRELLVDLLRIPSPSGRTDEIMQFLGEEVDKLGLTFELNRRGAMRIRLADAPGPRRAVVVHADTIGVAVRRIKDNGRLALVPIGTHSARFSEGARVTVFTDEPGRTHTGTILPLKASGHAYGDEVDTQGVGWDNVELRLDANVSTRKQAQTLGINVGDFVALHALPEVTRTGYVKSRHLDDKAAVAASLAAVKAIVDFEVEVPVGTDLLITITEEVGHGASSGLHDDVAEMLSIDAAVVAPLQSSSEHAVTVAMQDMVAPFDFHLTRKLIGICDRHHVPYRRDVFVNYRSDVAAALEAGAETRAALIGPGVDATHGHERTHLDSIRATAQLVALYLQTELTFPTWDKAAAGPLEEFPSRSVQPADRAPGITDSDGNGGLDSDVEAPDTPGVDVGADERGGAAAPPEA
jgi:peptidase M42 family hydrolase